MNKMDPSNKSERHGKYPTRRIRVIPGCSATALPVGGYLRISTPSRKTEKPPEPPKASAEVVSLCSRLDFGQRVTTDRE